jgi:hypothetical protein
VTPTPPQKFAQPDELANTTSLRRGGVIVNALNIFTVNYSDSHIHQVQNIELTADEDR